MGGGRRRYAARQKGRLWREKLGPGKDAWSPKKYRVSEKSHFYGTGYYFPGATFYPRVGRFSLRSRFFSASVGISPGPFFFCPGPRVSSSGALGVFPGAVLLRAGFFLRLALISSPGSLVICPGAR